MTDDAAQATGQGKYPTPPYIAYKTFQTLLGDFKEHGLPPQIDWSVMTRFSGGVQSQLKIALRSLDYINEKEEPAAQFKALVDAFETAEYAARLREMIERTYPYVLKLDLMTATPSMFASAFSGATDAKEDSLRKCRAFFLAAAKDAGIAIGGRIENAKFPRSRSTNGRKARSKPVTVEQQPGAPPPPPSPSGGNTEISDKALEYKLVDLMKEDGVEAEERAAIWTLIQYLTAKAKKAQPNKKTATDP